MATQQVDKRSRVVRSALKLFHERGYNTTSIADIAENADVPLGNVYYYFKTKDEIGEAVIEQRAGEYRALRESWNEERDPKKRVRRFIQMTLDNCRTLIRYGCPVGSLCSELHKDGGSPARQATGLFREWLDWLETQFRALGKKNESRSMAIHVISVLQGAILLTQSFRDSSFLGREARRLETWLRAL